MSQIRIPTEFKTGVYTLEQLPADSAGCVVIDYDEKADIFTYVCGRYRQHCIYQPMVRDILKDTEAVYTDGKLSAVYINSQAAGVKLPLLYRFEPNSFEPVKRNIECVELCVSDFMKEMENADKPLCSMTPEYFYDGQCVSISLHDDNDNIYELGALASCTLECLCLCIPENLTMDILGTTADMIRKQLAEKIPQRFKVVDGFKISEPQMYD